MKICQSFLFFYFLHWIFDETFVHESRVNQTAYRQPSSSKFFNLTALHNSAENSQFQIEIQLQKLMDCIDTSKVLFNFKYLYITVSMNIEALCR